MLISGSNFLAIPSNANIFVSSVANYPSSFILCCLITRNIPFNIYSPLMSFRSMPSTILNIYSRSFVYLGNQPGCNGFPLYFDIPYIIYAHFLGLAQITSESTFKKYFRFYSVKLMIIPTSISATCTLALSFINSSLNAISY